MALSSKGNNFERNREDEFLVEGRHIPVMEVLEIGHDGGCAFSDWHLQHVEIFNSKGGPGSALLAPTAYSVASVTSLEFWKL